MCWCITHAAIAKLTATRFMIPAATSGSNALTEMQKACLLSTSRCV
ncbi:hypothetical protein [Erwinia amylovora]